MANAGRRTSLYIGASVVSQEKAKPTEFEKRFIDRILTNCVCSICLEVYKKPCVLTCGHMFCFKCFEEWTKSSKNTCPLCRQNIVSKPVKCEWIEKFIADIIAANTSRSRISVTNESTAALAKKAAQVAKRPIWK